MLAVVRHDADRAPLDARKGGNDTDTDIDTGTNTATGTETDTNTDTATTTTLGSTTADTGTIGSHEGYCFRTSVVEGEASVEALIVTGAPPSVRATRYSLHLMCSIAFRSTILSIVSTQWSGAVATIVLTQWSGTVVIIVC